MITGGLIIASCVVHGTRTECVPRQDCAISSEIEVPEPFHTETEAAFTTNTGRVEARTSSNVTAVTVSNSYSIDAWIETPDVHRNA
jgi:hypothetical protein